MSEEEKDNKLRIGTRESDITVDGFIVLDFGDRNFGMDVNTLKKAIVKFYDENDSANTFTISS